MARRSGSATGMRVLLVTEDDAFSAAVKQGLHAIETLSLGESSVWTAIRAGLDVTRCVDATVIDGTIGGLLQLRLYERLRPSVVVSRVPIVFARASCGGGLAHDLDFYLPPDSTPHQAARLVCHVLGLPWLPPRVIERLGGSAAAAMSRRARQSQPAAMPPGLLQRLGLWGVGAALVGFTFWPIVGSTPVREAVSAPIGALTGAPPLNHMQPGR